MLTLLRWITERRSGSRAAQLIVFDGAADVERSRAFFAGVVLGGGAVLVLVMLTAPRSLSEREVAELATQEARIRSAEFRADQASRLAAACVETAESLGGTLQQYRRIVDKYPGLLRQ